MKIIITVPKLTNMGGVANYYNSILPHLKAKKHLSIQYIEVGRTHGVKTFFHPFRDQLNFRQNLIQIKPDIVHINPYLNFNSFIRDGLFILQAKRKKIPVIIFWRGCKERFAESISNNILSRLFFKNTFLAADMTIILASDFKKKLLQWGMKSEIKLSTTTIDESLLKNFNIFSKLDAIQKTKEIRILFLSNIIRQKGIFETLEAFSLLMKKYNIHLDVAGEGTDLIKAKAYSRQLQIPENKISFLGYIRGKEKKEAFIYNHIYCFPTYYGEGMPNSVLEAMAFGMPVITRPVGGLKDFFQHKKMGFMTERKSSSAIASNIESLILDRELICQMAEYNHNYAMENFISSVVSDKLTSFYETVYCRHIQSLSNTETNDLKNVHNR